MGDDSFMPPTEKSLDKDTAPGGDDIGTHREGDLVGDRAGVGGAVDHLDGLDKGLPLCLIERQEDLVVGLVDL